MRYSTFKFAGYRLFLLRFSSPIQLPPYEQNHRVITVKDGQFSIPYTYERYNDASFRMVCRC